MKSLIELRNSAELSAASLVIEGEIGYWPMIKEEVRWELSRLDDDEPIEVRIDSIGGDPMSAIQIYNLLSEHSGTVTIYIEGYCLSATTVIACAGDEVIMNDIAVAMIHDATAELIGWYSEEEMDAIKQQVNVVNEQMRQIYIKRTGASEQKVKKWMKKTTWFTAQQYVDAGFADRIEALEDRVTEPVEVEMAARAWSMPQQFTNSNTSSVQAAANQNNQQNKSTTMSDWLKKIQAKLGLKDDADEADTVLTVSELKAKADKVDSLQSQLETLQQERDELKAENEKLKGDQQEESDEEVVKALDDAVKKYKIKAADKETLKEKYKGKPDELKAMLEYIPEGAQKPGGDPQKPSKKTSAQASNLNPQVAADLGIAQN